jgi:hypothetical protein
LKLIQIFKFGAEISIYWDFYWRGNFIPIETKAIKKYIPKKTTVYFIDIKVLEIEIPESLRKIAAQFDESVQKKRKRL